MENISLLTSLLISLFALIISIIALIKSYEDRNREALENLICFARASYEKIQVMHTNGNTLAEFYQDSIFLPGFETYHLCVKESAITTWIDNHLLKQKRDILLKTREIIFSSRTTFRDAHKHSSTRNLTQGDVNTIRDALSNIRKILI